RGQRAGKMGKFALTVSIRLPVAVSRTLRLSLRARPETTARIPGTDGGAAAAGLVSHRGSAVNPPNSAFSPWAAGCSAGSQDAHSFASRAYSSVAAARLFSR